MATGIPFVQSPAEKYAAEHYATEEQRLAHAASGQVVRHRRCWCRRPIRQPSTAIECAEHD